MWRRQRSKGWSIDRRILAAGLIPLVALAVPDHYVALVFVALSLALLLALVYPLARRLEESEFRLRAVTDNAAAPIAYIDAQQRLRFANPAFAEAFDIEAFRPHVEQALGGRRTTFETEITAGGRSRNFLGSCVPDVGPDGRVLGVVAVLTDVSRLKDVERELSRLAHYDPLTGAANRVAFDDHLWQALGRARRSAATTAVMCVDIDRLKALNARFGREAGDELLRECATRLKASLRLTDTVGRLGGDTFVAVLEGVGGRLEAERLARKVLKAMREPIRLQGVEVQLSASLGVALGQHDAVPEQLLKDAETALGWAKAAGRDTCRVIDQSEQNRSPSLAA